MRAPHTAGQLQRRAYSLGIARGFDYAMQLVLPIVLVRFLDPVDFGQYRLLWLIAGTFIAFATLAMPASLFYFLPRSDGPTQRLYVKQTILFLTGAGLIAAIGIGPWNPWLPESIKGLGEYGALVPAFLLLWIVASLLDALPTAEERVRWQVNATISLAALRTVALSAAAVLTGELEPVLWALLGFVLIKAAILLAYVAGFHGVRGPLLRWQLLGDQIRYAAPFGTGGALYMFRIQADQWIAAMLFPIGAFAAFSIAAVLGPLLNVFRQAVSSVFLPSMSRLQANGDIRQALNLNNQANTLIGTLLYPLLACAFVFAEDLITIVYTATYVQAGPVMRVYIVGLVVLVIELATVMQVLRQGPYMFGINAVTLVISIVLSWYAAQRFGLPGAAVGSVCMAYLDRALTLWRIASITGIRIRSLQPWGTLALLVTLATVAGALAWTVTVAYLEDLSPPWRVVIGSAVLGAAYGVLYRLFAVRLRAIPANREPGS